MTDKQRRSLLFAALAGVAAWSVWLAVEEPAGDAVDDRGAVAEPARHKRHAAPTARAAEPAAVRNPSQDAGTRLAPGSNLFPEQTWYIPPPPPPPPPYVPPPPPQAPPLPFSYMGRWQDAGQTTYYLVRGSQPVSVHAGQVLDGVWRLEAVAGGMLNFTYLPLNQTRSLRTGD